MLNYLFRRCLTIVFAMTVAMTAAGTTAAESTGSYRNPGITNPSEQRGLNFNVPGVVSKVMVKEGDLVKKGQIIAEQDSTVDVAELKAKEADVASSTLQIEAAVTDLEEKKVVLARDETMFKKNVIGKEDLEKAKLDVDIGAIRIKLAEQETEQKKCEVAMQQARIVQKQLFATIDGVVQKINVHEGELATNDPKTPCIQIVQNQPLNVEIDIPVADAQRLEIGQIMDVRYNGLGDTKWQNAKIVYFNPVASAAAGMQRVRLELDNSERKLRSGLQVEVAPHDPAREKGVAVAQPAR